MLTFSNVSPMYNGVRLFDPVDFEILPGEIACIMGHSGVGKSSLLKAVTGDVSYEGNIKKEGVTFTLFQDLNQLFPWYSIEKNLNLVCKLSYQQTVKEWKLNDLLCHKPNQVSGGQRQRFTFIRAIYSGANILLCDEPLSAVDGLTSRTVALDFKKKVKSMNISCLWITHNPTEACLLADKLFILKKNKFINLGKSRDVEKIVQQLA